MGTSIPIRLALQRVGPAQSSNIGRKQDQFEWYWQLTMPQAFAVTAVLACAVYSLLYGRLPPIAVLGATTYWGGMHLVLFGKFITYSWRGVQVGQRRAPSLTQPEPAVARA